jgi:hypothetical protein
VDDAAGGQRGTRAIDSADLKRFLRAHWGVRPAGAAPDLGGSSNLNLHSLTDPRVHIDDETSRIVVRQITRGAHSDVRRIGTDGR